MMISSPGARSFFLAAALLSIAGTVTAAPTGPAGPKPPDANPEKWPRKIQLGEMKVLLDAPEAESLEGTSLKARGPLRVEGPGETEPSFGTIWYEADVEINRARRIVTLVSVRVPRVQLEGAPPARQQRLATRLSRAVTRLRLKLSLDDVLASARMAPLREGEPAKLGTSPPKILFETEPAILVLFDGEPRFRTVEGTGLERALNTPFLVLREPSGSAFYLDGGTVWFRAPEAAGPWSKADHVPQEATGIARQDRNEAGIPEKDVDEAKKTAGSRLPKILVATEPTELIVSEGSPEWKDVVTGELAAMSNTESDVFRTLPDHRFWVVLSGRWYRSDSLGGNWTWVEPDQLPESFRRIPKDSTKAAVLAFVPGTATAREALKDVSTPRTAAIRRKDAHVTVTYDGDPRFEAVPGTHLEYALNSPEQVLRIRGRYYVCDQGVWFTSGTPEGPWHVADSIPEEEIRTIPPESPAYNTRFVTVYDSTPDTVYVAYTPAYLGSYPWYGTVVFGTGWYYRPWWGAFYYPRPWTWGFHPWYRPWGGWGFGLGWGPAWAGFRFGFGLGWGARWCGPGAFYRAGLVANVNRNVTVNRNVYNSGANQSRAMTTQTATSKTPTSKSASARSAGSKSGAKGKGAGATPHGKGGANSKGAVAHAAKGGHAHGGGKK